MHGVHKMMQALHFIAWLEQHTEYAQTAVVLAEYVAKTALLSRMQPDTAKKYTDILKRMGISVEKVNNQTLAECAMEVALPVIKGAFDSGNKHENSPSTLTALVDAMSIAQDIMRRIHDVANTSPDAIKAGAHHEMATFICANKATSAENFEKAATSAYGETAHWLAMAMPSIKLEHGVKDVGEQLKRAYIECNKWAKDKIAQTIHHPEVAAIVHDAILDKSLGLHSGKTPMQEPRNDTSRDSETPPPARQGVDRQSPVGKSK
jgi:antitoxin component of RelBE/YafQ-DinJ toxin-antitoxin module